MIAMSHPITTALESVKIMAKTQIRRSVRLTPFWRLRGFRFSQSIQKIKSAKGENPIKKYP